MTKFAVGDRVRVYGWFGSTADPCLSDTPCTIERIDDSGHLYVRPKKWNKQVIVHPKQCRKLIKKERRRVWIAREGLASIPACSTRNISVSDHVRFSDDIEFIEVVKK